MKPSLLFLPFLSLFVGAVGTLVSKANPNFTAGVYVAWGLSAAIIALWVFLDRNGFKSLLARKGTKYGTSSSIVLILGISSIVAVAVLTSRPRFDKSYDVTKDKLNTLSDQSLKTIENLNKQKAEIKGTAYFLDDAEEHKFRDLIDLYLKRNAKIDLEYVNLKKDPTRAMADKITSGNTVIFKLATQENRLSTFTEEKVTNALLKLLKSKTRKIYFTTGHGEGQMKGQEATGYQAIVTEFENNKYDVAELSLLQQTKVPEDADLVIVAGPKYDFKPEETKFLEDYLLRGGAVLAMVDAMVGVETLRASLEKFGVKMNDDLLILSPNDPRAQLIGQNNAIVTDFDAMSPITKDFSKQSQVALLMPNSRSLTEVTDNPNKMKITMVAKTANIIVKVKNVKSAKDLQGGIGKDRVESGVSFPVIAVANGKLGKAAAEKPADASDSTAKETRMVVTGSSAFATNQGAAAGENRDMVVNIVNYLLQDDDFISIRAKDPTKTTLNLAQGSAGLNLGLISFIYPFLFLVAGVIYWARRRQA